MRYIGVTTAALVIAFSGAAPAAAKAGNGMKPGDAVPSAHQGTPPGQMDRPDDPDMGDDNASPQAIGTVCTMDTPAAERSAICEDDPPFSRG